jgi:hypothetical protein
MRTSQDNHYESVSQDGGETWDEPRPSRFYGTITMPTLGRLRDGRILLLWNNTTPLPEVARDERDDALHPGVLEGYREDVFTNRDVIHAAISADEGKTWQGFRELYLDPRRAASDYGDTGGSDRGLHQSQFVEVEGGAVLASVGQHWLHRSLLRFHPDWLLAKRRTSSFENGLEDWCVHMYVAGIRGHCASNRESGAGTDSRRRSFQTPGASDSQAEKPAASERESGRRMELPGHAVGYLYGADHVYARGAGRKDEPAGSLGESV